MPSNDHIPRFDGIKHTARRAVAEKGGRVSITDWASDDDAAFEFDFKPYRKTTLTYAAKVPFDYMVETLEGMHHGKAGTYLAIGQGGEMYPIDPEIFENTYEGIDG